MINPYHKHKIQKKRDEKGKKNLPDLRLGSRD